MSHRTTAAATLILSTLAGAVHADGALDDVLAADRAFAARSAEAGAQAAFLEVLAPDAVLFRPTAVTAVEWLRTHEEATGQLDWSPALGRVSCDGQVAVTLGSWSYRQDTEVDTGYYLTVWHRTPEGSWQVVLDHGIDAPAGAINGSTAAFAADPRECAPGGDARDLPTADDRLNEQLGEKGMDASLRAALSSGGIVLRDGHLPSPPTTDWPRDDATWPVPISARTRGVVASAGSDLGYTYGELAMHSTRKGAGEACAVFVRVWWRDGHGWQLLADMTTSVPVSGTKQ